MSLSSLAQPPLKMIIDMHTLIRFIVIFFLVIFLLSNEKCHYKQCQNQHQRQHSCLCLFLLNGVEGESKQGIPQQLSFLSQNRSNLAATSSGDLVFFGGGQYYSSSYPYVSNTVDVYNVTNGIWTRMTFATARQDLAATSSGNVVFFAGGWNGNSNFYNEVDMFNTSNGIWTNATLSQSRCCLAATSVANLVLFAGGQVSSSSSVTNIVDVYNVMNNTWTVASLIRARSYLASTSIANRWALFAGGYDGTVASYVVDIFDSWNGIWWTAILSQARQNLAATSVGNLAFFGGGRIGNQMSNVVDIYNSTSQMWSTATLSQNRSSLAAASFGEIVAFGGGTLSSPTVDLYNMTSNNWFVAVLSQSRQYLAATSSTNTIFFGGGQYGSNEYSGAVDMFIIPSSPSPSSSPPSSSPQNSTNSSVLTTMSPQNVPTISLTTQSNSPITIIQSPSSNNSNEQTLNSLIDSMVGAIVGAYVIIFIVLVMGLSVLLYIFVKMKKINSRKGDINYSRTQQDNTAVSIEGDLNIILSEDYSPPSATYREVSAIESKTFTGSETLQRGPQEIPLNELEIGKEIGKGRYGRVCIGKWKKYRVALKFCQNRGKIDEFLREANLMISLPSHPNVVRMYGVSIDGTQPIIVMEYCAGGSLDHLLYDKDQPISNEQKMKWVVEIAQGMCHLHKYNIVHRDLAARNILLSQSNPNDAILKISDFGMSRVLQQDIESRTMNPIGPIRWMAPESIGKQVYSKKSDVWMFGILVYEIVAQREPHPDINHNEVAVLICNKALTPKIPEECPDKLRQLREMCWKKQPEQRPTFDTICALLQNTN